MARRVRAGKGRRGTPRGGDSGAGSVAERAAKKLPLPSPSAATNVVIADIVLRAAGGLLRDRMEKGILVRSYDKPKAHRMIEGRGITTSLALWGASHLARRSPIGLALVAGGLAAKVFYDRGKRLEAERAAGKVPGSKS
jgi:hypothetical protein